MRVEFQDRVKRSGKRRFRSWLVATVFSVVTGVAGLAGGMAVDDDDRDCDDVPYEQVEHGDDD